VLVTASLAAPAFAENQVADEVDLPRDLQSYADTDLGSVAAIILYRVRVEPFNAVSTVIFLLAIIHTFAAPRLAARGARRLKRREDQIASGELPPWSVDFVGYLLQFVGQIEVVFGLWAVALFAAIATAFGWHSAVGYIADRVDYTEAVFIVVVMAMASTRPVLRLAEDIVRHTARLFGGSLTAWWLTTLTAGPLLGSFITEPAAMTLCALLLGRKFYELKPSTSFGYATLGLLFTNVSVGGLLTHSAAPPVVVAANAWDWTTPYLFLHFGWKAAVGIALSNAIYLLVFRSEFVRLGAAFAERELEDELQRRFFNRWHMDYEYGRFRNVVNEEVQLKEKMMALVTEALSRLRARLVEVYRSVAVEKGVDPEVIRAAFEHRFAEIRLARLKRYFPGLLPPSEQPEIHDPDWDRRDDPVPLWVTSVHLMLMAWTIANAHHPALFVPGLLLLLTFMQATGKFQNQLNLGPPILVGFFLAGLVIHGGLQGWWIEPILRSLQAAPLALISVGLSAVNDNTAVVFLTTLVPNLDDALKHAVLAGAVAGGGLTVIANAPNPAGYSLLRGNFPMVLRPKNCSSRHCYPPWCCWAVS
jgi:Putative Na+/H+ antiporter